PPTDQLNKTLPRLQTTQEPTHNLAPSHGTACQASPARTCSNSFSGSSPIQRCVGGIASHTACGATLSCLPASIASTRTSSSSTLFSIDCANSRMNTNHSCPKREAALRGDCTAALTTPRSPP